MERVSKEIKDKELLDQLLNIKEKDITSSFIFSLFGEFNGVAKVNPYDFITIPPGYYGSEKKKNKNSFVTTVGIWVYNKWFFEEELFDVIGYINKNIDGGVLDDINQSLSYALMEDRITVQNMKNYLIKTQLIMPFVTILAPNDSEKILTCTKAINKKKDELFKKYEKELKAGDIHIAEMVEKELLDFAVQYVGNDPSMDTYLSKARGSIKNHFKNTYVMRGAVRNPDPNAKQEYDIAKSCYADGVSADEYALYCNSAAAGPYSRGKKTEDGGYLENLFTRTYQDIILDEKGTDCHTTKTITIELTKKNLKRYIYSYIVQGSQLIELNSQNAEKYYGKKIKLRFACLCEHEKICNACAGNIYYKLGIKNVGLTLMQVPSAFKNKAMKAFHDSTVQTTEMDTMKAFGLK